VQYKPRERYISELWDPDEKDPVYQYMPGRFRAELHERLVNPLYPLAFVIIAFALLGRPRTSRQNRFNAIGTAIVLVFAVRLAGLGATNLVSRTPWGVPLLYAVPLLPSAVGLYLIFAGGLPSMLRLRQPPWLQRAARGAA
jgi:lipopolysaccharide export system permease protein